jgi:hypothetical protein
VIASVIGFPSSRTKARVSCPIASSMSREDSGLLSSVAYPCRQTELYARLLDVDTRQLDPQRHLSLAMPYQTPGVSSQCVVTPTRNCSSPGVRDRHPMGVLVKRKLGFGVCGVPKRCPRRRWCVGVDSHGGFRRGSCPMHAELGGDCLLVLSVGRGSPTSRTHGDRRERPLINGVSQPSERGTTGQSVAASLSRVSVLGPLGVLEGLIARLRAA